MSVDLDACSAAEALAAHGGGDSGNGVAGMLDEAKEAEGGRSLTRLLGGLFASSPGPAPAPAPAAARPRAASSQPPGHGHLGNEYRMLYVRVFPTRAHETYITMAADGEWADASVSRWRARVFEQLSRAWGGQDSEQAQDAALRAILDEGPDAFVFRVCGAHVTAREWDRWLPGGSGEPLRAAHAALGASEPMLHLELRRERETPPAPIVAQIRGTDQGFDLNNRTHTLYVVEVTHGPLEWKIRKRYSEFHALHEQLPGALGLPRLPGKKALGAQNPDFVAQRRAALHDYLVALLDIPELQHSVELLSFLGVLSTARHTALSTHRRGEGRNVIHLSRLKFHVRFGDVILFRCASTLSGLQRRVTGAEWDHVGMVVRSGLMQSYDLLEATGDGVTTYPLVSRIRAYSHQFTKYMVVRRLEVQRTRAMADRLAAFVDQVTGLPYGFTPQHLFPRKRASGTGTGTAGAAAAEAAEPDAPPTPPRRSAEGDNPPTKEESSYFCSQLVARALIEMGVLPQDRNASYFWPGSFAAGGELDQALVDGASLGEEIVIDCQVLEVSRAVTNNALPRTRSEQTIRAPRLGSDSPGRAVAGRKTAGSADLLAADVDPPPVPPSSSASSSGSSGSSDSGL